MKWLAIVLFLIIIGLQYKLWVKSGSLAEVSHLKQSIATQTIQNAALREGNAALEAEVLDLKQGVEAIEERARSELGMIKQDETFFQIVEDPVSNK